MDSRNHSFSLQNAATGSFEPTLHTADKSIFHCFNSGMSPQMPFVNLSISSTIHNIDLCARVQNLDYLQPWFEICGNASPAAPWQQAWDYSSQDVIYDQHMAMAYSQAAYQALPMFATLSDQEYAAIYHLDVATCNDSSAYHSPEPTLTGALSRRPSQYSDQGFMMPSQAEVLPRIDLQNTESGTASTPSTANSSAEQSESQSSSCESRYPGKQVRCYDHGCDGREFASISNLRRHQRERDGQASVCSCPYCGVGFYRRWTRDHHVERKTCWRIPR